MRYNTVSSTEICEAKALLNGQGDAKVHDEGQVGVCEMSIKREICGDFLSSRFQ